MAPASGAGGAGPGTPPGPASLPSPPPGIRAVTGTLLPAGGASGFQRPVRDLVRCPPVTCPPETRIADAARLMQARGTGSIVVVGGAGAPLGIVTDRDLRAKVVAAGLPPTEPVARIMSAPLHTVAADAPALEALLEMLRRGVRHLPVLEREAGGDGVAGPATLAARLVGVVSSQDFLALRDAHPVTLLREIERQERIDDLTRLAPKTTTVVRVLLDDGVPPADLARVTAELNDAIVRRVLALTEAALEADGHGRPPAPYCWLALGSEGRREQTLRTDQDNALVYDAPPPDVPRWAVERYFQRLAEEAVAGLIRCGFPRCPADVMASNPRWRQPLHVWRGYFSGWIRQSAPDDLLQAAIFFDFRPVWGEAALASRLADHLREEVAAWRAFLRLMAWAAVSTAPPIGLFGRLVTPWRGPARGTLNLKLQGMLPMVNGVRVHALELALPQTNTLDRLAAAADRDHRFTQAQVAELTAAYDVITRLRLRQQASDLDAERSPTSRVVVAALNRAERAALAEAFRAIGRLQDDLRSRFMTDLLYG